MAEIRHINSAGKNAQTAPPSQKDASTPPPDPTAPLPGGGFAYDGGTPISPELFPELFTKIFPKIFEDDDVWHRNWRVWAVILALAFLAHVLFMNLHIDWASQAKPTPVDINTIDPAKLAEIKKRWRNNQQKQLLIDTAKDTPSAKEAADKAKYMSDRNIVVQKEQRARETGVMPKAGAPGAQTAPSSEAKKQAAHPAAAHPKAQKAPKASARAQPAPSLSNLGIPMHLTAKTRPEEQEETPPPTNASDQNNARPGGGGANQWVDDPNVPQGSENLLNAQESVYYSFYSRLYEAIAPVWSSRVQQVAYSIRVQPGDYTTVVDVVLNADGDLVEVRTLHPSGISEFDGVVEPSWKQIGRFPNPPKGLLGSDGNLHMAWSFTMRVGSGGMSLLPPVRDN